MKPHAPRTRGVRDMRNWNNYAKTATQTGYN
jgi:hypothetical protein